jgi:hypothetical protein
MEGLYGPDRHPAPRDVLEHVRRRMREMVRQVVAQSVAETCSFTEAALRICAKRPDYPDSRPYGRP